MRYRSFAVGLILLCGCTRTALSPEAEAKSTADEPNKPAAEKKETPEPTEAFRFPKDVGGALLAQQLAPSLSNERIGGGPGKRTGTSTKALKMPQMPLPVDSAELPRLPSPRKLKLLRPRLVSAETLDDNGPELILPERALLPAGARVRSASRDLNEPLSLPPLAQPVPNRASLEDATVDVSAAAVLTGELPQRALPAPFLRLTLPDPQDHRRPVQLPEMAESAAPQTGSPQTPR